MRLLGLLLGLLGLFAPIRAQQQCELKDGIVRPLYIATRPQQSAGLVRSAHDAWSRQGHSQVLSRVVGAVDASPPGPTGSNNRAGECNVQDSAAQRARSCPCLKCWNWSSGGAPHSNHELTSCATAPQDVYGGGVAASTMAMSVDA